MGGYAGWIARRRPFAAAASLLLLLAVTGQAGTPATKTEDDSGLVQPPAIDAAALARELGLASDDILIRLLKTDEKDLKYSDMGLSLAKEIYPDLKTAEVEKEFDKLGETLKVRIGEEKDARKIVRIVNKFFYEELKLHAPRQDMAPDAEDPDDYFPNKVYERRQGVCLGLTLMYLILAERAALPITGVHAPMHIFARYDDGKVKRNIECTNFGIEMPDAGYAARSTMTQKQIKDGRYFRPVSKKIVLGDLLNAIAWCSATGTAKHRLPPDRAVAYARVCCVIDPSVYNNWDTLAEVYYYARKHDKAVEAMDRAMGMDPAYSAPFDKAYYQKRRDKYVEARDKAAKEKK